MFGRQKPQGKNNRQVRIQFTEDSFRRLEKLKEMTEAEDIADIMMNALRLYEATFMEANAGSHFFIQRPGKEIEPLEIF
jgi:hypothetical protein